MFSEDPFAFSTLVVSSDRLCMHSRRNTLHGVAAEGDDLDAGTATRDSGWSKCDLDSVFPADFSLSDGFGKGEDTTIELVHYSLIIHS